MENKEVRHVLNDDVAGSKLANGSGHLSPQNGLGMSEALSPPGGRGSLARETADNDVDSSNSVRPFGSRSDVSDIAVDGDSGPALLEDRPPEGVGLCEPGVLEPGEVEPVVEQADAGEEGSDTQRNATRPAPASRRRLAAAHPRRPGPP